MQWFAFATLAVVTYGAWLWSRRRRGARDPGTDDRANDRSGTSDPTRPLEETPGTPAGR
jgi:hypothetical protein